MHDFLVQAFSMLFVTVDPVGLVPVFIGLTARASPAQRRSMALRAVALATGILLLFAWAGPALLAALGVGIPALRIAGGALLFLLALDMILVREDGLRSTTAPEQAEARKAEDISVFPLAIPLIAGPGALTSIVLLMGQAEGDPVRIATVLGMLLAVLLLCAATLTFADLLSRVLGVTGANVVGRVLGLLLAALAAQFIIDGLRGAGLVAAG